MNISKANRYVVKPITKSYTGYKNILMLKLEAIKGQDNGSLFDSVYGVNETDPSGYPCVYVIEKTGGGKILDTHRNEREWQFSVVIHQTISANRTVEQAYEVLLDAVDRVVQTLDQDPMLLDENDQAQCKWAKVVPVEFEYGQQDTPIHRALLTIGIVDVVNRYAQS
jgi:hypothetical protein